MHDTTKIRLLSVWLPDWPIQRVRLEKPALDNAPLIFSQQDSRTELVSDCSIEARRLGIRVGMRTPDAQALAASQRLLVLPTARRQDRLGLERLAEEGTRFSPVIALEDSDEPSALLMDITGLALLWGQSEVLGERRLAAEVSSWLSGKNLKASLAIASTVGLALSVARYSIASRGGESNPVSIVPPRAPEIIAELPIEALRVDIAILPTLHGLGIRRVGDLLQLPRAGLRSRFGPDLGNRLDQLLGVDPEPLVTYHTNPPLQATWPFETPTSNSEVLEKTLRLLLERLAIQMQQRDQGALRVRVRYQLDCSQRKDETEQIVLRLFRPTQSAKELAELAKLHSDKLHFRFAVREVDVLIGSSVAIRARQRTLFDETHHDDEHELTLLINRLASRLGNDRVARVEKRRSVDPAYAYALSPATETPAKRFEQSPRQAALARRAPLARYSPGKPIRIEVDQHGVPTRVHLREPYCVVRYWGPERVETGWWRGQGTDRDAYWVELDRGIRLWLSLDRRTGRWSFAGEFF